MAIFRQKLFLLVTHTGIQGGARECHVLDASLIPKVTPVTTFCGKYNDILQCSRTGAVSL